MSSLSYHQAHIPPANDLRSNLTGSVKESDDTSPFKKSILHKPTCEECVSKLDVTLGLSAVPILWTAGLLQAKVGMTGVSQWVSAIKFLKYR